MTNCLYCFLHASCGTDIDAFHDIVLCGRAYKICYDPHVNMNSETIFNCFGKILFKYNCILIKFILIYIIYLINMLYFYQFIYHEIDFIINYLIIMLINI